MTESWTFVDGHTEGGANLTLAPEDPTDEFTTITFNSVADSDMSENEYAADNSAVMIFFHSS